MEKSSKPEPEMVANNEIEGSNAEGPAVGSQDDLPSSSSRQTSPVLFIGPLANPSLAVETRYVPRDVKDPMAVNGSCGLYNLGNTCFMNSGLQSLASCPPLLKFFFEGFSLTGGYRGTLTAALYQLLVKMWSGRFSLVQPRPFKDLLGLYHPQFQDYRQHDCQEFLALLLDTLHEQLNNISTDPSSSSLAAPPSPKPTTPSDPQDQGHLNNEELSEMGAPAAKAEKTESSTASEPGCKLLCPETLPPAEDDLGSGRVADVMPRSSQGQSSLSAEPAAGQGRSSLKRISSSSTEAVMASLFSEDSNHSTLSAHSTDSEQSNAFKKLKIESDSTNSSGVSVLSSVSELSTQETSGVHGDCTAAAAQADAASKDAGAPPASDNNNSAESGAESMEMSPPAYSSIPQRKCVRLDMPSSSQGSSFSGDQTVAKELSSDSDPGEESGGKVDSARAADSAPGAESVSVAPGLKKFNNRELPSGAMSDGAVLSSPGQSDPPAMMSPPGQSDPPAMMMSSPGQSDMSAMMSPPGQSDVSAMMTLPGQSDPPAMMMSSPGQSDPPVMMSPQDSSRPNPLHFYCKETKTLNTNVLVSNFVQGDVSTDSEKFAKVDNRSQVAVTKEVNILHEALQGLEDDKVEKALIGKSLGSGSATTLHTVPGEGGEKSGQQHVVSNLRTVKTRQASGILCKATADPNLLNNSYEFEEEMVVGFSSLVGTSLQKPGSVSGVKRDADGGGSVVVVGGEKLEVGVEEESGGVGVGVDKVSCEVEKNVQMQAMAKVKNSLTKSNIREDISDKASTSESTETEDGDMEVEAEESSEEEEEEDGAPSRGGVGGDNSAALPNPARCFTAADVSAANAAWESYRARNNSVVVDTFQGQFKSTVVCSECDHVSVTYEPFMYLSLPIPHAMERQICVVYVRPHKSTVRYLLTLHKNDKVQHIRRELQALTCTENTDVIIAEVLDNHVSRILDENIMLRYVNDNTRTLYAFQMLPPPEMPPEQGLTASDEPMPSSPPNIPSPHTPAEDTADEATPDPFIQPLTIDITAGEAEPSGPQSPLLSMDQVNAMLNASQGKEQRPRSPSASKGATALEEEGGSDEEEEGGEEGLAMSKLDSGDSGAKFVGGDRDGGNPLQQPEGADPMLMGTGLWEWSNPPHPHHYLDDPTPQTSAPPTSPTSQHSGGAFPPADLHLHVDYSSEALFPQSPSSMDVEADHIPSAAELANPHLWPGSEEVGGGGEKGGGDAGGGLGAGSSSVMDQWQTCAICLEELMDSHLLTHQVCSGVFCHSCLEMSARHSGDLANSCPVCLCPVDVTQDFVPLASSSTVKSRVRILAIPVTFRAGPLTRSSPPSSSTGGKERAGGEERGGGKERAGGEERGGGGEARLVCGPRLTYVASHQDAGALYRLVDRVVPFMDTYSLHFTDGQGLRCSRCEFSAHCPGCEVAREGEIALQPCDNLTVHFKGRVGVEEVEATTHVSDDVSVQRLRSSNPISIHDCFEAFTQSEVLDEHNPWYCPGCQRNQCAKKTMTVWRYPDNLIIHLKRFVYEDLSSTKIDNRVVFPHTSLDVTRFLAGPNTSFSIYDLYSIVCHYGGANSGHYTAFSCHPVTSEWYNYNDETVTQQKPGDSEFDSSYILFFRRQGPQLQFDLVKDAPLDEDEVTTNDLTSCPPSTLPTTQAADPTEESTSTAVITFETDGFACVADSNAAPTTSAGETENGNYDFYN